MEERASAVQDFKKTVGYYQSLVHIVMIVQLPHLVGGCQTFAGFQGGRWVSVHIDELRPPTGQIPAIEFMVDRSISELFDVAPSTTHCEEMEIREEEQEQIDIEMETSVHASNSTLLDKVDIISLLRSCIQAAVARIDDESRLSSRSTRRIEVMLNLLPDDRSQDTSMYRATLHDLPSSIYSSSSTFLNEIMTQAIFKYPRLDKSDHFLLLHDLSHPQNGR